MQTSYPKEKIKVVLLENIHPRAAELFQGEGFSVERHAKAYAGDELIKVAGDASILGIRSKTTLTPEFFERAERLWCVGCFCIGTNQVSLGAASARGVPVFNAPFSNTRSVAELTIAEIIALHRGMFERSLQMHRGEWVKSAAGFHEVRGRTLGIVGYGRIGSQVSVLAEAMGMRVLLFDVATRLPMGNAQPMARLEELLRGSDVVSLHVPSTEATRGMIGAEQIRQMRDGAILINNARGEVVDLEALAQALRSGKLAGAALDVFPQEPEHNDQPFESPVRGMHNVILTPHIAGSTEEAQRNIAEEMGAKLSRFMNNGSTSTAVNVPEVDLPLLHPGSRRVLHFHTNVPGVLQKIHAVTGGLANVVAQYLQSDPRHSYMIMDMDLEQAEFERVYEGLRRVPETIKIRWLR